ncbi:hypothetical protein ACIQVL_46990 [Streptomyces sp. NPDC090499]|uniref:hypothetical protein n=1 Tax=Streptomyces sp. NPDC090499 TaxID=3365965 RepID=UPI003819B649
MDANQAASSYDAFDALLEASSLGAPRARAVRQRTPAAIRDLLTSRLAARGLTTPDTAGQPAPHRVTQAAQPPSPQARKGRDLPYALPVGSRSHHVMQFKGYSRTGKLDLFSRRGCASVAELERSITGLVGSFFGRMLLQSLLWRSTETVAGASMKTGWSTQLYFTEPGGSCSMLGRYGVGTKLDLASALVPANTWHFDVTPGALLGNGKFLNANKYARVESGWPHSYGQSVFNDAWTRACSDVAQHLSTVPDTALLTGSGYCMAWVHVFDPCACVMSAQTRRGIAPAARHVPGAVMRTQCDACGPRAGSAAAYALRAAVSLHDTQGSKGSSRQAEEKSKGESGRHWQDHLLAACGRGAPGRAAAGWESGWEQLVYRLIGWSAAPCDCPTAETRWRDMRASREERQASKVTSPQCSWSHEPSEFWSTSRRVPGRFPVDLEACMEAWFGGNIRGPVPGIVAATHTAELLRSELIERLEEQAADPLSLALEPLWTAFPLQSGMKCCAGKTQESSTGQEVSRLLLPTDSYRTVFSVDSACSHCHPYTVLAIEGVSKERTAWTFSGPLAAGKERGPGGLVLACAADHEAIVETEPCGCIRVSRSDGEIVLRMNLSDLAQFLDVAREDADSTNEHDRLGRPAHSMRENTDDQNALHRMPSGDALLVEWLNDAHRH